MSRLLQSEFRLSANRVKEHPRSAAKPSRYQTRLGGTQFPTVAELQMQQPKQQFTFRTPQKRLSVSRISPEKKFLFAIDTARYDLVNKKGSFQINLDNSQNSPLFKNTQLSRRSINRNTFRLNSEPTRNIPPPSLALSPMGNKQITTTGKNQEIFGLRFLSPRRAN